MQTGRLLPYCVDGAGAPKPRLRPGRELRRTDGAGIVYAHRSAARCVQNQTGERSMSFLRLAME